MKKILLPANYLGLLIMLVLIALCAIVPFVLALWLVSLIAPWWVAVPVALAVSLVSVLLLVNFKGANDAN
jgi:hypothetical protein